MSRVPSRILSPFARLCELAASLPAAEAEQNASLANALSHLDLMTFQILPSLALAVKARRPELGFGAFLCHSHAQAGAHAELFARSLESVLHRRVFLDRNFLKHVHDVLPSVLLSDMFLVLMVSGVEDFGAFSRPYCLVEMIMAQRAGLKIVCVDVVSSASSNLPLLPAAHDMEALVDLDLDLLQQLCLVSKLEAIESLQRVVVECAANRVSWICDAPYPASLEPVYAYLGFEQVNSSLPDFSFDCERRAWIICAAQASREAQAIKVLIGSPYLEVATPDTIIDGGTGLVILTNDLFSCPDTLKLISQLHRTGSRVVLRHIVRPGLKSFEFDGRSSFPGANESLRWLFDHISQPIDSTSDKMERCAAEVARELCI